MFDWIAGLGRWFVLAARMPGDVKRQGEKIEACESKIDQLTGRFDELEQNHLPTMNQAIADLREEVVKLVQAVGHLQGRMESVEKRGD